MRNFTVISKFQIEATRSVEVQAESWADAEAKGAAAVAPEFSGADFTVVSSEVTNISRGAPVASEETIFPPQVVTRLSNGYTPVRRQTVIVDAPEAD